MGGVFLFDRPRLQIAQDANRSKDPFVAVTEIRLLLLDTRSRGAPNRVGYFSIKNQRLRFFILTPAPPPFSAMNSTPAFSMAL
jgi:hypothetical protein